ncbi:hemolysin family protein [Nocardia stercoris]|uniref:HlyC/CorC family transporter n=1 Tax=Nocardia stercoris TaxID=2483361 RepID=A0A3M2L3E1_9NOCA|nr:hemolysin family protein [Nocardia stercoris]RMI32222.1 HlyC/CorC family transporter [Nocardia stercoris]
MNDWLGVILTLVLVAGNAFFVGAEFALITARRDRLEALAAQGKHGARTVIRAGEQLSLMLAAAQLGVTICSLLLGRIGEPAATHLLGRPFELLRVPAGLQHPIAFAVALAVVVVAHMLLGEMIPKNIALAGPEKVALLLVPGLLWWLRLARPVTGLYNFLANLTLRVLRIEQKDELDATVSTVELAEMIGESRSEGLLDAQEHRRLTQALGTTDRTVADVMVPLASTRSVPLRGDACRLGDIEAAVAETGFSRYPVRAADGMLVGYLHVKDVLDLVAADAGPTTSIPHTDIRPLPTVGRGTALDEALARLRRTSSHLGRVVDVRGATVGIVALEDLVEEFVGTVRDATHQVME